MNGSAKLEPIMIAMALGGRSGKYPTDRTGEKFALVFEGEVTLTLGDEMHVLRKGDAVTFASANPHQWENTGVGPAQVVIIAERLLHGHTT
jgi:uncharacterized cupin superfamily protein